MIEIIFFVFFVALILLYENNFKEKVYLYDYENKDNQHIKNIYDKIIVYDSLPTEQEMEFVKNEINFQDLYIKYYEKKGKQFDNLDFIEKYLIYNKKRRHYTRICSYEGDAWIDRNDFDVISFYCKLNNKFIEKHFDKLNISCLSHKQKLSEEIILNHFYSFYNYFENLIKYQNLNEEFVIKLKKLGANFNLA